MLTVPDVQDGTPSHGSRTVCQSHETSFQGARWTVNKVQSVFDSCVGCGKRAGGQCHGGCCLKWNRHRADRCDLRQQEPATWCLGGGPRTPSRAHSPLLCGGPVPVLVQQSSSVHLKQNGRQFLIFLPELLEGLLPRVKNPRQASVNTRLEAHADTEGGLPRGWGR